MLQIGWKENQYKGQIMFDLAIAVIAIALIVYVGLYIVTEINNANERALEEQILFNIIISAADYLVKTRAVEKEDPIFGSTVIYHHQIIESALDPAENELKEKLHLEDLNIDICPSVSDCSIQEGYLCVNRIVLSGDEIKNLQVCGK